MRSVLQSRGLEAYLPTVRVRRNARTKIKPFFSCYLFARFDPVDVFPAMCWTPGLRRVVGFDGQLAVVPDQIISSIRRHVAGMAEVTYPAHRYKRGDRVAIESGPFRDFEAIFDQSLSSGDRVRVLMEFMGRWTMCEVSLDWLGRVH